MREQSRAHKAHGGQTDSGGESPRKSSRRQDAQAGRKSKTKPQDAGPPAASLTHSRRAAAPPCTPARRAKQAKQRQQKPRTHKRTAGKRQAGPGSADQTKARHKSSRLPASRGQGSGAPAEKCRNTGHKSRHNSGEPRKSDQPRQAARHAGRRKTPPNRQNSRSLFCLPGGAM